PYIRYLHGRVTDGAFEAACFYEYARLSSTLEEAARLYKQGISEMEAVHIIGGEASTNCLLSPPWSFIWTAPSFPDRSGMNCQKANAGTFECRSTPQTRSELHSQCIKCSCSMPWECSIGLRR